MKELVTERYLKRVNSEVESLLKGARDITSFEKELLENSNDIEQQKLLSLLE